MRFLYPEFFWLLLLLPLLALWRGKKGSAPAIEYSSGELVREVARERRFNAGRFLFMLRLLSIAFLIVALARPQFGHGHTEIEASGIDIVLAIDVSSSMEALDFKLNGKQTDRLEVVKSVVSKFIQARTNDRIAILAFAGRPYLVSPLTLDHSWLLQNLDRVRIGLVEDQTAIGSAIAASVNRLRDQPSKSKIVILLTDGVNNAGKVAPETAADAARAFGIKIYAIGAGAQGHAHFPARDRNGNPILDPFGKRQYIRLPVDVDEATLKKVAETTGGQFYRATDTDSLEKIYSEIDRMEKTSAKIKKYEHYDELFKWALVPALFVLGMEIFLSQTRFRRLP